jgi:hypothetical protein
MRVSVIRISLSGCAFDFWVQARRAAATKLDLQAKPLGFGCDTFDPHEAHSALFKPEGQRLYSS